MKKAKRDKNEWKRYAKSAGCNPRYVENKFNVDFLVSKLKLGVIYKPGNEYTIIALLDKAISYADKKTMGMILKAKDFLRSQVSS